MKQKQTERILKYMKDFGSITQAEAFTDLGISRLSARIWDIRHEGYGVLAQFEKAKNRYGEPVHYIRYSLAKG